MKIRMTMIYAKVVYSLGARILERHVGIETNKYSLNKYSLLQIKF